MGEKELIRIDELKMEIESLYKQLDEREEELNNVAMKDFGTFEGSYIEYYDSESDENTYMIVEDEWPMNVFHKTYLEISGPAITLNHGAISDGGDENVDLDAGAYDSFKEIRVNLNVLTDKSASTIRKISKEDFDKVFESWVVAMRKKIISED